MLTVIAVLIAAKKAAQLLCERSRALLVAEFFAGALKSLRKGIAVCIADFRPLLLLLLPLQAALTCIHYAAEGLWAAGASSSDVELAVSGAGGS
jgi:hypothetical protein